MIAIMEDIYNHEGEVDNEIRGMNSQDSEKRFEDADVKSECLPKQKGHIPKINDPRMLKTYIRQNSISIFNLLISIVSLIFVNIIAFNQVSNQKEILAYKADLEKRYTQADLEVCPAVYPYINSSEGYFQINNIGLANAKNSKIDIIIDEVADEWASMINSIEAFEMKTFPSFLDISTKHKKVDVLFDSQKTVDYNAKEYTIKDITPNGSFRVSIRYLFSSVPTNTYTVSNTIKIHIQNSVSSMDLNETLHKYINEYLIRKCKIARFRVLTSCDNCSKPVPDYFTNISSLTSWGYSILGTEKDVYGEIIKVRISLEYCLPINYKRNKNMALSDLKLDNINTDGNGKPILYEANPNE